MDRNAVKAALYTALWTFVGLFSVTLLGWLNDVGQWAMDAGDTRGLFPSMGVLAGAALSAAASAFSGVVALIVREAQARGVIPGRPPAYPNT